MMPILLRLGPLVIYSFGLSLFGGFVVATFLVWRQARLRGLSEEKVFDTLFLSAFLAIFGGRVGYVISNWPLFSADLSRVLLFGKYPGLAFNGVVLTAVLAVAVVAGALGLEWLLMLDLFTLAFLPMTALGFLGCYLDGCKAAGTNIMLWFFLASSIFFILLVYALRKFLKSPRLSDLARRPGIFFLCYLIFISVCLLMLAVVAGGQEKFIYLLLALLGLAIFFARYSRVLKYIYDSVPKNRFRPDFFLP